MHRSLSRLRTLSFAAVLSLALAFAVAGCGGGGDDIKDAQATATAAAKTRPPSPTAAPNAVAEYRARITAGSAKLGEAADTLIKDMLAAGETQADPRWPTVLTNDADLLAAAATAMLNIPPPSDAYRAFSTKLNTAADTLSKAASTAKQSVQRAEAALGAMAFALLSQGKAQLAEAMAALPPA